MPQYSDSSYAAVSRYRRPYSTAPSPYNIDLLAPLPNWTRDVLPDDDLNIAAYEAQVAPLLEEGELDVDAMVVSPSGNSSAAAYGAAERRRREEGWNDLGLDQFENLHLHTQRGTVVAPQHAYASHTVGGVTMVRWERRRPLPSPTQLARPGGSSGEPFMAGATPGWMPRA